jgi:hypothetical protein
VQGRLRNELIHVNIETVCEHGNRPITIKLDSEMNLNKPAEAAPLVFRPQIDGASFSEPDIIHAF